MSSLVVRIGLLVMVLIPAVSANAQTVGQVYRDRIQLESGIARKTHVPLPEGDWLVVAKDFERTKVSNVRLFRTRLVQVSDRVLKGYIYIVANDEFPNSGWTVPGYCTRKDTFFKEPDDTRGFGDDRGFNCVAINHVQMTSGANASAAVKQFYDWVWNNTTGMPTTLIASIYEISDGKRYVEVMYHRNPEAEGFAPPRDSSWRSSDWHKDRLRGDARKLAYMNAVKQWTMDWKPLVEAGFNGTLTGPQTGRAE